MFDCLAAARGFELPAALFELVKVLVKPRRLAKSARIQVLRVPCERARRELQNAGLKVEIGGLGLELWPF